MNLLKKGVAIGLLSLMSLGANAEFLEADYLTSGDGLSTIDQKTGIEWLDFTQTRGHSYNSIMESIDTVFAGWRFPTESEVIAMYGSFFPDINLGSTSGYSGGLTAPQYTQFMGLFGVTDVPGARTYAFYLDDNDAVTFSGVNSSTVHFGSYKGSSNFNSASSTVGYLLVSDGGLTLSSINDPSLNINNANAPINQVVASVPLPASLSLLALAMVGFSARRKGGTSKVYL